MYSAASRFRSSSRSPSLVIEPGDVGRHALAERAAEEGIERPVDRLPHNVPQRDIDGAHRCNQLAALRHERGNTAHRGIGQREQVLPYSLDVERILPNDERANALQDFVDGAQALGPWKRNGPCASPIPTRPASVVSLTMTSLTWLIV